MSDINQQNDNQPIYGSTNTKIRRFNPDAPPVQHHSIDEQGRHVFPPGSYQVMFDGHSTTQDFREGDTLQSPDGKLQVVFKTTVGQ